MEFLPHTCFMCLRDGNLKQLSINEQECLFSQFVKYVLPEYVIPEQDPSLHICSICQFSLHSFYKFKKMCLENNQKECKILPEIYIKVDHEEDDVFTLRMDNEESEEEILSIKHEMKDEDAQQQFETTEAPIQTTPICETECIKNDTDILCSFKQNENQINSNDVELKVFDNSYKCCICYKTFRRKYFFDLHINRHIVVKHDCLTCNKSFASTVALRIHKKTHTTIERFQCAMCLKKFTLKKYLAQHIKSHIGIKKFQCSFCNKKFLRRRYLEAHERIHTGVRDFKCSICGKEFTQKVTLDKHLLIHSGTKRYECSVCNKRFIERNALNRHLKVHSEKTK